MSLVSWHLWRDPADESWPSVWSAWPRAPLSSPTTKAGRRPRLASCIRGTGELSYSSMASIMHAWLQTTTSDDLEMYICNARHRWMHGRIRSIGTAGHMSVGRIRSCDYEHDVLPNGRPDSKRSEECQHRCHGPWIDDGRGAPLYMPAGGTMWSTSGNRHCNCFFWVTFCVVWTAWRTKLQRNKLSLDGALSWNHYPCPLFFFLGSKSLKLISFGYIYITSPGRRREEVFPCILFIRVKSTIDP